MKKALVFIVMSLLLFTSCFSGRMVRIKFGIPEDYINFERVGTKVTFADELDGEGAVLKIKEYPSYKIDKSRDKEKIKKIMSIFNIESETAALTGVHTKNKGNEFVCDVFNSGILCRKENYLNGIATMSDEQAKKIVNDFMTKNNLIADGFYLTEKVGYNTTGSTISTIIVKYKRRINGVDVHGWSDIQVGVDNSGIELYSTKYCDYSTERITPVISLEDAKKRVKAYGDYYAYDSLRGLPTEIKIQKVEMVYYAALLPGNKQNYIQPCYLFTGMIYDDKGTSTEYTCYVRAVPDRLTVAR